MSQVLLRQMVLLGQQTDAPAFATWGWIAAAVFAAALFSWWLARSPRTRTFLFLLAVVAGVVALAGVLTSSPVRTQLSAAGGRSWSAIGPWAREPFAWAIGLGAVALLMMLPRGSLRLRSAGAVVGIVSLGFFAAALPLRLALGEQVLFWALAVLTVASAAATISMRSAVYAAIWFAMSLLGTAALFFFQGAQFLGVATIVVYAGAIVVTFLFVVMLAQPEGNAVYDRISWGWFPRIFSVVTAGAFVIVLTVLFARPPAQELRWKAARALPQLRDASGRRLLSDDQLVSTHFAENDGTSTVTLTLRGNVPGRDLDALTRLLPAALAAVEPAWDGAKVDLNFLAPREDVLHPQHMAHLGSELFSRHLVSVEAAGTVLLAALVGAVAIVSHGSRRRDRQGGRGE